MAQNIFLCNEIPRRHSRIYQPKKMEQKAAELLERMGRKIDSRMLVKDLTVSEQQMVEIAKVLSRNAWLLILDEPTSSLTEVEKEFLFETMRNLRQKVVSMIYIHRMQEIFELLTTLQFCGTDSLSAAGKPRTIQKSGSLKRWLAVN